MKPSKPWVMPHISTKSGTDTKRWTGGANKDIIKGLRQAGRGSRLAVDLEIGALATSITDARAIVTETTAVLVDMVKQNWSSGKNAGGESLGYKSERKIFVAGVFRPVEPNDKFEFERQAIAGSFITIDKLSGKRARRRRKTETAEAKMRRRKSIEIQKRWIREIKKQYTYDGRVFFPYGAQPRGYLSGLLVYSLHSEAIKIREVGKGHAPKRVSVRMAFASKRAEPVQKLRMAAMHPTSETWRAVNSFMTRAIMRTTIYGDYRHPQNLAQLTGAAQAKWEVFRRNFMMGRRAGALLSRKLTGF